MDYLSEKSPGGEQKDVNSIRWLLDCAKHGKQEPIPDTIRQWPEEHEKVLRSKGIIKENEHYFTGDCPVCGSCATLHEIHQKEGSENPTSEHKPHS